MKPNMLLNIVGIIMILIAGVGIAVYEEPEHIEGPLFDFIKYDIEFVSTPKTGPVDRGTINDGDSSLRSIDIVDNNLTKLEIAIDWDDNYLSQRISGTLTVSVDVTGPDGQSESHSSSGRSDSFTFVFEDLNTAYNKTTVDLVEGDDEEEYISDEYPAKTKGTGTWEISISVSRSRPTLTGSIDYNIGTSYNYFKGRAVEN